jgi:hypothetical protein
MLWDRAEDAAVEAGPDQSKLPHWLLLAISAVFVFIAGLCVPYTRAVRTDARLETTTRALTLARLENALAAAGLEARGERYESARQLASQFFSGLERAAGDVPADIRQEVRAILAYRDTTITVLSRGAATSADMLDRLLAQYHEVVRATEAAKSGAPQHGPSSRSAQAESSGDRR